MIAGFAVKMNSVVREGDRWLNGPHASTPEPEPETDEIEDEDCEEGEEPQVSILPISPGPAVEKVDPANVVLGKSAEQVEKMAAQAVVDGRIEL